MRLHPLSILFLFATLAGLSVAALIAWISTAPRWRDQRVVAVHLLTAAMYCLGATVPTMGDAPRELLVAASLWSIAWGGAHYFAWLRVLAHIERRALRRWEHAPAAFAVFVVIASLVPGVMFEPGTVRFGPSAWGLACRDVVPTRVGSYLVGGMILGHLRTVVGFLGAAHRRLPRARFFAVSALGEALCATNDMLAVGGALPTPYLTPLWLLLYQLAIATSITGRFIDDARELDALSNRLEERVTARTRELAEARTVAEAAARAKGSFLAMMSHEIRTPMNGVIGMTSVLLDGGPTREQREQLEQLETIRRCGLSLLSILNDILDFSKIEAGRLVIESAAYDPRALASECVDLLAPAARDQGTRLELATPAALPARVVGDPARVRQVLVNLVGNAVKFTRDGAVTVRIEAVGAGSDARLRFTVRDTGVGISEEAQARLFEPFVQADTSTTRRFGGTGLGLAICRRLVEAMEGALGVDSAPGRGATFWFTVPLVVPTGSDVALPLTTPVAAAESLRVLVAEDNVVNQRVVTAILKRLGHEVRVVANGREALDALEASRFDVVLMDCQMPEMDGYAATRVLREREGARRRTRVVALTANVFEEDRLRAFAVGMDAWLAKPFRKEELERALRETDCQKLAPRDEIP